MKGWIRLAIVFAALWMFGCAVVLVVELALLPEGHECAIKKPPFEIFFRSTQIDAVNVRCLPLGIVSFPITMSRQAIEVELRKTLAKYKFYESANATIDWDIPVDKQTNYYGIYFDSHRIVPFAIFPAIAIFAAVLAAGYGTRWVRDGFDSDRKRIG